MSGETSSLQEKLPGVDSQESCHTGMCMSSLPGVQSPGNGNAAQTPMDKYSIFQDCRISIAKSGKARRGHSGLRLDGDQNRSIQVSVTVWDTGH